MGRGSKMGVDQNQVTLPICLAQDVKTLLCGFSHDVLALAVSPLAVRQELFDFIVSELGQREDERYPAIRKLRKALYNQRDQLLAFAGVLDQKLADIAAAAIVDDGLFCDGSVTLNQPFLNQPVSSPISKNFILIS